MQADSPMPPTPKDTGATSLPQGETPASLPQAPPIPEVSQTALTPRKRFPFIPLLILIIIVSIGFFALSTRRALPAPTQIQQSTTQPVPDDNNPFADANIPEDNPFDNIEADGTIYENPFDILEEETSSSTNPFEDLR